MEHMDLDADTIRRLRNERAWSQGHLASVAGLSLRTVQRVESAGTASAETRMALAAAFDVDLATLGAPTGCHGSADCASAPACESLTGASLPMPGAVRVKWSYRRYRFLRLIVIVGVLVGLDVWETGHLTWSRWVLILGLAFAVLRVFRGAFVDPPPDAGRSPDGRTTYRRS